jgi:hypothetical protein
MGKWTMVSSKHLATQKSAVRVLSVMIGLIVSAPLFPSAVSADEGFSGPTFRRGMWRFVRTLEIVTHSNVSQKLLEREMTRCVDPTQAMKATFASSSVGSCHSAKPEKINNKWIFSNRCDYMGPVSTVITVQSDEAYTEANELHVGQLPRKDLVIAKRVGDCREDSASLIQPSELPIEN